MAISKIKTKSIALSAVNSDIIHDRTIQFIDLDFDVESKILNTYTTVLSNSANWNSSVSNVFTSLTATNITVTNTVSAKFYEGTILDWMTLVRGTKTTPTLLATIGTGEVYTYVFATTGTDKTYYRYIATNGSEDSFYGNFTNPTLSNLIATKKIIL